MNCYVEPVYTVDADFVCNTTMLLLDVDSQLRIQFTTDARYQAFLPRAIEAEVLGIRARIACLQDVVQGKLWAYSDSKRRLSKRKKDELDLIRLAEAYPELKASYPRDLVDVIDRG